MESSSHDALAQANTWVKTERPIRQQDQWLPHTDERMGAIDLAAGRLLFTEVDFVSLGAFRVELRRSFSSTRMWRVGVLGSGFCHPFEQLLWCEREWIFYRTTDGREIPLGVVGSGELPAGARLHNAPHCITVQRLSPQSYLVREPDGARYFETTETKDGSLYTRAREAMRLVRIVQPSGFGASLSYDGLGRLAQLAPDGTAPIRFEHDPATGRLTSVLARTRADADLKVVASYAYDESGRLRKATDGLGRASRYQYEAGRLLRIMDRYGVVTRFGYRDDEAGRCIQIVRESDERTVEVHFDPQKRVAVAIDVAGWATKTVVSPNFRIAGGSDACRGTFRREVDAASALATSVVDRVGHKTELVYDANDHLSLVQSDSTVVVQHDEDGQLCTLHDANDGIWRFGYDALGLLHAKAAPDGTSVVYERDAHGRLTAVTTPGEMRLELLRDASDAIVGMRSPFGTRSIRSDALGRPVEVTDEVGHVHRFGYDERGDLELMEIGEVLAVRYTRNASGAIVRVDRNGSRKDIHRDADENVVAVVDNNVTTQLGRDANGRLTSVTCGADATYELVRDARGAVMEEDVFGLRAITYRRDAEERIVGMSVAGVRTEVIRDSAGRPIEVHYPSSIERFEHDKGGYLSRAINAACTLELTRDPLGRVTKERSELAEIKSVYGPHGRRIAVRSSLGISVFIDRDAEGNVQCLRLDEARPYEITWSRDALGRERERILPGDVRVLFERDGLGRCTRRQIDRQGAALSDVRFGYRGDHLVRIDESSSSHVLGYDAHGRLLDVQHRPGATERRPLADAERDRDGRVLVFRGHRYEYDASGRRTKRIALDGAITRYRYEGSRLIELELSDRQIAYAYDALGRLIGRTIERDGAKRVRDFVWDGPTLLHEREGDELTSYLHVDGELVAKLTAGERYAVLLHPYGTPSELFDESGALAWQGDLGPSRSARRVDETPQPFRLCGHWEDPDTGLAHSFLRVFDPEVGAYLTPSPHSIAGLDGYFADPFSASPLGFGAPIEPFWAYEVPPGLDAELASRAVEACTRPGTDEVSDDPWACAFGRMAIYVRASRPALGAWTDGRLADALRY